LNPLTGRPEVVRVLKPGLDGGAGYDQKLFVVAFDPGVTTGWCVMRIRLDVLMDEGLPGVCLAHPDPALFAWSSGYFQGPEPYQAELMLALLRGTWMYGEGVFDAGADSDLFVAAIEGFTLRTFSMDDSLLSSPRVSAAFLALAWRVLTVPVVKQSPADALGVFTDHRLKALNLWSGVPGKVGEHQRDATRHAALVARSAIEPRWINMMAQQMKWLTLEPKGNAGKSTS
jgi:hypothetical protein